MGKSLIQQKRGKGSHTYKAPSHRYKAEVRHLSTDDNISGRIMDIVHDPGHSAPLIQVKFDNQREHFMLAPEGVKVGDVIETGGEVAVKLGNTTLLKNIPEGTLIHNIEAMPGDGGKFVRASGVYAKIISKVKSKIKVQLPSKKIRDFHENCRASVGTLDGSDRTEKPFMKAGNKYHKMRARNKLYPKVGGVSMNSVSHPFGGSSSHMKGRPTQSSRNAPPGRKVGKIAPKRTGRKKR